MIFFFRLIQNRRSPVQSHLHHNDTIKIFFDILVGGTACRRPKAGWAETTAIIFTKKSQRNKLNQSKTKSLKSSRLSALCVGFKKEKTSQKFTSNLTEITFYIFLVAVAIFFKSCLKIHRKNIFFFCLLCLKDQKIFNSAFETLCEGFFELHGNRVTHQQRIHYLFFHCYWQGCSFSLYSVCQCAAPCLHHAFKSIHIL